MKLETEKNYCLGGFFPGSRRFCFLVAMPFVYLENGRRHFYGSCLHGAQESRSRSSAQRLPTGPGERAPPPQPWEPQPMGRSVGPDLFLPYFSRTLISSECRRDWPEERLCHPEHAVWVARVGVGDANSCLTSQVSVCVCNYVCMCRRAEGDLTVLPQMLST